MRVAVLGALGNVGRRVVAEAQARGHSVTAVARDRRRLGGLPAGVHSLVADAGDARAVGELSTRHDVVVCATRPAPGREHEIRPMTKGMLEGIAGGDARLLVVGGAATLAVPEGGGRTVLDDPRFLPPTARAVAAASAEQHALCRATDEVDWVYLSPPAELVPGERTGHYRVGGDELLTDDQGRSWITMEDLAVAVLDEVEHPTRLRERFTVAR